MQVAHGKHSNICDLVKRPPSLTLTLTFEAHVMMNRRNISVPTLARVAKLKIDVLALARMVEIGAARNFRLKETTTSL